jgi:multiple sugar transport system substrate-binding protein
MTWPQVLDLAKRVSSGEGDERIYGIATGWSSVSSRWITDIYGGQLQLRKYDPLGETMTINTPQWAQAFTEITGLVQEQVWPSDEVLFGSDSSGEYRGDFFQQGRLAMSINDSDYIYSLENGYLSAGQERVDWGVVSVPVQVDTPDVVFEMQLYGLAGINAKATNVEDAWDYLAFLNGKEWANTKVLSSSNLISRMSAYELMNSDFNLEAFHQLKPIPLSTDEAILKMTRPGISRAESIGVQLFYKILSGEITVSEALTEWEKQGNEVIGMTQEELEQDMMKKMQEGPQK